MLAKRIPNPWFGACVTFVCTVAVCAAATGKQTLVGHVPKAARPAAALGRLPATNRLNLAISLPLRNRQALDDLLAQLYNPASPLYRHYLTSAEFAERFGPSKDDYDKLIGFAIAQGLSVTAMHPNRSLLDVSGSVDAVERAFHVVLRTYP
ncbi:MAG: protease pro-enzyme activation domain-containing protein, partial [Limisphaerales bacterium]